MHLHNLTAFDERLWTTENTTINLKDTTKAWGSWYGYAW